MGEKSKRTPADHWTTENVRTITNLFVVLAGVFAVMLLAGVAIALLGASNKEAVVAITTSSLGIISAVVSAYFGIRATANTAQKAASVSTEKAGEAAVAKYEVRVKKSKVDDINKEIDQMERAGAITQEAAEKLRASSVKAEDEARRTDPMNGFA
ncbi:MAG TPA: hypothetical protein VIT89_00145 [Solirubrobacterales bacterium]